MLDESVFYKIIAPIYTKVSPSDQSRVKTKIKLFFFSDKYPTTSESVPKGILKDFKMTRINVTTGDINQSFEVFFSFMQKLGMGGRLDPNKWYKTDRWMAFSLYIKNIYIGHTIGEKSESGLKRKYVFTGILFYFFNGNFLKYYKNVVRGNFL